MMVNSLSSVNMIDWELQTHKLSSGSFTSDELECMVIASNSWSKCPVGQLPDEVGFTSLGFPQDRQLYQLGNSFHQGWIKAREAASQYKKTLIRHKYEHQKAVEDGSAYNKLLKQFQDINDQLSEVLDSIKARTLEILIELNYS